jgi:WD repeat and SOF domain-containing protein 1
VKRIARHRHVPKHVLNAKNEHRIVKDSRKKKDANRRKHSKPGAVPYVSERETHVLKEVE